MDDAVKPVPDMVTYCEVLSPGTGEGLTPVTVGATPALFVKFQVADHDEY